MTSLMALHIRQLWKNGKALGPPFCTHFVQPLASKSCTTPIEPCFKNLTNDQDVFSAAQIDSRRNRDNDQRLCHNFSKTWKYWTDYGWYRYFELFTCRSSVLSSICFKYHCSPTVWTNIVFSDSTFRLAWLYPQFWLNKGREIIGRGAIGFITGERWLYSAVSLFNI